MSALYHIDEERAVICCNLTGYLTGQQLLGMQRSIRADPMFKPGMSQLLDATGICEVTISAEEARLLAWKSDLGPGSRRAIVGATPAIFALCRMLQTTTEQQPEHTVVFHTLAEAHEWLGLRDALK